MKGYDARYFVFSIRNDTKFDSFVQLIRTEPEALALILRGMGNYQQTRPSFSR